MIKYALFSIILYYVVVKYLRPNVDQGNFNAQNKQNTNQHKNNDEDEYVDYEEVN